MDCSHGWRAPATFDACHHALGRAHACGHIALRLLSRFETDGPLTLGKGLPSRVDREKRLFPFESLIKRFALKPEFRRIF